MKSIHNSSSSKTESIFIPLDKMCAIFSVNTEDFSSSKNCKTKMNHTCKILLSYYCSAQLFETAMIEKLE